jgi:UDP-glucose 4-epimerase
MFPTTSTSPTTKPFPLEATLSSIPSFPMLYSEVSTPNSESGLCFSGVSTPATEPSVLFDENFQATPPEQPHSHIEDDFILVIGGLGYIGSHTSWELLKNGKNVIIIDNFSNCNAQALANLETLTKIHFQFTTSQPDIDFYAIDYRNSHQI